MLEQDLLLLPTLFSFSCFLPWFQLHQPPCCSSNTASSQAFKLTVASVQFSSVAQSCPTLCDPMNRSTPGLPVHHQLPEFTLCPMSGQFFLQFTHMVLSLTSFRFLIKCNFLREAFPDLVRFNIHSHPPYSALSLTLAVITLYLLSIPPLECQLHEDVMGAYDCIYMALANAFLRQEMLVDNRASGAKSLVLKSWIYHS